MSLLAHLYTSSSLSDQAFVQVQDKFGTADMAISKRISYILSRDFTLALLENHVATKPQVPAVVSVEGILADCIGEDAFTDDMKQYTGWRVRQIVEALGGEWVKAGVRINNSRYKTASIYRFPKSPFELLKVAAS